jgi:hypothetical protein
VLVFLLHLRVAQHDFGKGAGWIAARRAIGIERDDGRLAAFLAERGEEGQFVEGAVTVEVVELAGRLCTVYRDQGRLYVAVFG